MQTTLYASYLEQACQENPHLAPVSGARCRGCGTRPYRKPEAIWLIDGMAAWCPECAREERGITVEQEIAPELVAG